MVAARRALALQVARFVVVGVLNFATTFAVVWLLKTRFGTPVWAASAVGYGVGMVQGFILNRLWTFAGARGRVGQQAAAFVAVNLVCGLAFAGLNALLSRWLPLAASTFAANAVVPFLSFVLYRQFVFRDPAAFARTEP